MLKLMLSSMFLSPVSVCEIPMPLAENWSVRNWRIINVDGRDVGVYGVDVFANPLRR